MMMCFQREDSNNKLATRGSKQVDSDDTTTTMREEER